LALAREVARKLLPLAKGNDTRLEEIALLQLDLGDLPGALETCAELGKSGDRWRNLELLPKIAAAQIEAGHEQDAFQTADRLEIAWRHRALIAMATAQTQAGRPQLGQETLTHALQLGLAIKDDYERMLTLRKVAVAQMQAGDATSAHATLAKLQQHAEVLKGDEFCRAFTWRQLAVAQWGVGERRTALETMQQATQHAKKVPDKLNRAGALQQIAMAWANMDELELACNAAEMIPPEENNDMEWARGEAFYKLAKAQICAGNVKAALALVSKAEPVGDWQDSLRVGIATLQAKNGDLDGALATAKQIANGTRRVEGMLDIATELAKCQKPVEARKIAGGLPKLVERWSLLREGGRAFNYQRPETWAVEYEFDGYLDNCVAHYLNNLAGDLAAAAMRFQMALPPSQTPLDYAKGFADLKFGAWPSKLREITAAQAAAGGARAALDWIVRLDATSDVPSYVAVGSDKKPQGIWKCCVAHNTIEARLGIVDGVLQRVKGDKRASADDWYDHW
jgi:hypothetical protein